MPTRQPPPRRQRGATLLEALVAFLVLSLGMLSMARLQNQLRQHADVARQRSEAVRLAQEDLEGLRAFSTISAGGGAAFDDIASGTRGVAALNQQALNTRYELRRDVSSGDSARLKAATVTVAWADRSGDAQQVVIDSVIAGQSPALSAALSLRGAGEPMAHAYGRAANIPRAALDLGDGRSAFKPVLAGDTAWVFDNRSGSVVARCSGVGATTHNRDLAPELTNCSATRGLLLSGSVRFAAPDAVQPLNVALLLDGSGATPECKSEVQKTVAWASAQGPRREAVPASALPASVGAGSWAEIGERFVAYHCIVASNGNMPKWSGRSSLVPVGWSIGNAPTQRKVCRYSADQDGSGAVDRNAEHPDRYADVDTALAEQNFLVVRSEAACPAAAALNVGGSGAQVFSALASVQHQP